MDESTGWMENEIGTKRLRGSAAAQVMIVLSIRSWLDAYYPIYLSSVASFSYLLKYSLRLSGLSRLLLMSRDRRHPVINYVDDRGIPIRTSTFAGQSS